MRRKGSINLSKIKNFFKKEIGLFSVLQNLLEEKSAKYKKWHQIPHISKLHLAILVILLFVVWAAVPSLERNEEIFARESNEPKFATDRVIVKLKKETRGKIKLKDNQLNPEDTGISSLNEKNKKLKVKKIEKIFKESSKSKKGDKIFDYYKFSIPTSENTAEGTSEIEEGQLIDKENGNKLFKNDLVKKYVSEFNEDPNVEVAQLDYIMEAEMVPNDPMYGQLWAMPKIQAPEAWDITGGTDNVIVGVVDTGIDYNHEDLQNNIWTNPGETGSGKEVNGIDDDLNGYVDDWRGWDFSTTVGKQRDNDPMDGHYHGTHVSGTIAAVANNSKGVVGLAWGTKLMAIKGLSDSGSGYTTDLAEGIVYGADNGAKVLNNSWGGYTGGTRSSLIADVVDYAHNQKNTVVVAAAGNSNRDAKYHTPANEPNVITVAATDSLDQRASFSNYGDKIDVAAPGVSILSTALGNSYRSASGTSMASPHVAALSALILSKNPTFTNEEVRAVLRFYSDDKGAVGRDIYFGSGRINAYKAAQVMAPPPVVKISSPSGLVYEGKIEIIGSASSKNGYKGYKLEFGQGANPTSWQVLKEGTEELSNSVIIASYDTTLVSDGTHILRLTLIDNTGSYSDQQSFLVDNVYIKSPTIKVYSRNSEIDIIGTARGTELKNYEIKIGKGKYPTTWDATGITLEKEGKDEILSSKLGSLNPSFITSPDHYKIRLDAYFVSRTETVTTEIYIDPTIHTGWPASFNLTSYYGGGLTRIPDNGPTLVDINNDGKLEIAYCYEGKILALNSEGSMVPGFPGLMSSSIYGTHQSPTGLDIDLDGRKELISADSGYTYAFNEDGSQVGGYRALNSTDTSNITVSDLNLDKDNNLVFSGSTRYRIANINHVFWGSPIRKTNTYSYSMTEMAAGDIDRDGIKDLVFVSNEVNYQKALTVKKPDGSTLPGWPKTLSDSNSASPRSPVMIGDLNNDGWQEIVYLTNHRIDTYTTEWIVNVFDKNGNYLPGFPRTLNNNSYQAFFSIADVNNDNFPEIVISTSKSVYILDHQGADYPGWPSTQRWVGYSHPLIADIDGDSEMEILVENDTGLTAFNLDKSIVSGFPKFTGGDYSIIDIFVDDIDNDGKGEVGGFFMNQGAIVWDIESPMGKKEHGTFGYNSELNQAYKRNIGQLSSDSYITSRESDVQDELIKLDVYLKDQWGENISNKAVSIFNKTTKKFMGNPFRTDTQGKAYVELRPTAVGNQALTVILDDNIQPIETLVNVVDTQAPSISIASPDNGSKVSKEVPIVASATDNVSISKVEFYIDNDLKQTLILPNDGINFKYSWDSSVTSNGSHTIKVKAYDISGRFSEAHSTVTVKNILSKPGVFSGSTWFLKNRLTQGIADNTFSYGFPAKALMCAWDPAQPDVKLPVIFSNGTWFMKGSNTTGVADNVFSYGAINAKPVCGDWDGDGVETVGVVDNASNWKLRNSNNSGPPDLAFQYGPYWTTPIVGDWDGDGNDTIGVVIKGSSWSLRNENSSGPEQVAFSYGFPSLPVIGDWDGDGTDTPGIVVGTTWLLRNNNSMGVANIFFSYGFPGVQPVVW